MAADSKGWTLNNLFQIYKNNKLFVNRDYQRKLVWTQEEKEKLIDTITLGYPVPLILLAEINDYYEIVDGMQRLNAIFSFLEQKYSYKNRFFDLKQNPTTNVLLQEGSLSKKENVETLNPRECANFLQFEIPVTIFRGNQRQDINEVFERINSYGRKLSKQDRRQSLSGSSFPSLVRDISSYIRDDYTEEKIIPLSSMPSISIIKTRDTDGNEGLVAKDIFWVSNGIVNTKELLDSEDEKIISDLVFGVANEGPTSMSSAILDKMYKPNSEESNFLEKFVRKLGPENIRDQFITVFNAINEMVNVSNRDLREIFRPNNPRNTVKTEFYALFMAFWDLIHKEEKMPSDYLYILNKINGSTSRFKPGTKNINKNDRDNNIKTMKGLISEGFAKTEIEKHYGKGAALIKQFDQSLCRSNAECSYIEFKQGIINLDESGKINEGFFYKLAKTISAIANSCEGKMNGEVFIGVADKKEDASRAKELFGIEPIEVHNKFIVGIDKDIKNIQEIKDIDGYERLILAELSKTPLQESLKNSIKNCIDIFKYKDLHVLRIFVEKQAGVTSFENKFFVRSGANTVEYPISKIQELAEKFGKKVA